jgi:superfamily II DNA or RNA helicase
LEIAIVPILDAVRTATRDDIWSRGVQLVRDDRVLGISEDEDEFVLSVVPKGRARPATVHLWPSDSDWSCDCPATLRPCLHIAAAAIALRRANEAGTGIGPTGGGSVATVGYRFLDSDRGLIFNRVFLDGDREENLEGPVGGRHNGPLALSYGPADELVETAVDHRFGGVVTRERLPRLFRALSDISGITLDGEPVTVSQDPVVPHGWVEDHGAGFRLRLVRDPDITSVYTNGVVACGETLHFIGDGQLSREQRRVLTRGVSFSIDEVGQLVGDMLPRLEQKIPVHIRTKRLPKVDASPPRLVMETKKQGDSLVIRPAIVYGDPPTARITRGEIEILGDTVPIRSERSEQRLIRQLGEEMRMAVGIETRLQGMAAVRFVDRLDRFSGEIVGTGIKHFVRVGPIEPDIQIDGDRVYADMGGADPLEVISAWVSGDELVSLPSGGWAPLPVEWLEQYGDRLADLLAARDASGRVARHALFDLARLCEELDFPPPPELEALRALADGFDGIPDVELPADFEGKLRDYQQQGVNWLHFLRDAEMGGVLADDMGLGKTVQALCVVQKKALVVAPRSVLRNWEIEANRFRPGLKVAIYHGPTRKLDRSADLIITTYALLRGDQGKLTSEQWDLVILDEAQAIKNPQSQVAQAAFKINAKFRLTLTGTPVENRLEELWSQIHFVNPGLLGGRRDFDERYAQPISRADAGVASHLRERIRPFVLRRLKSEVAPELPPRTESILRCHLSPTERGVYNSVRAATQAKMVERMGSGNVMAALEALLRLRQASCHSALVPGQEADSSAKVDLLIETLMSVISEGHKSLVFSQWTSLLNLIEPHLNEAEIPFIRLDGQTRDRQGVVDQFQSDDGPPVMLISLKAGGTGLNLTAADHVFLVDPWWNPAVEDQAADRTHRIGQDKPVIVYRLVAEDTVEERILVLQQRKRALAAAALGSADQATAITRDDLMALLA